MADEHDLQTGGLDGEMREVLLSGLADRHVETLRVATEVPVYGVAHGEGRDEAAHAYGDEAEAYL